MNVSIKSHHVLIIVIVVCVLVIVGDWARTTSTEAFVAFVGTLVATFVGVGAAAYISVWRFYAEAEEMNRERSQLLAQSLAGELFSVLDILGGSPNVFIRDPAGKTEAIPVVFAQLEPTATEEAIRVGLLGSQSSANLTQLSNLMRDYTKASDNLYPLVSQIRLNPAVVVAAHPLASEIVRLCMNLIIWCTTVLYGLAAQGIQMPHDPLFRTDPKRVTTRRTDPSEESTEEPPSP